MVAVVIYKLDATFTRRLQLTPSATFQKYASQKLFHNPELSCLLRMFSVFVYFKIYV